jgi:hypothetical protein
MDSLTMAAVSRIEPMVEQIYNILRDCNRGERNKAQTVLSAHRIHNEETWGLLELELRAEGIPGDYIQANKDLIEALVDEVVQEEGLSTFEDIGPGDSVSQQGLAHDGLSTPQHTFQPVLRPHPSSIPINATPAEVEAATILLMNQGFDLRNISNLSASPLVE